MLTWQPLKVDNLRLPKGKNNRLHGEAPLQMLTLADSDDPLRSISTQAASWNRPKSNTLVELTMGKVVRLGEDDTVPTGTAV